MKKIVVVVVALAGLLTWGRGKLAEHGENSAQAEDYAYQVCGKDPRCEEVLDAFVDLCIQAAYDWSPSPGGDTIDLDAFVGCLNDKSLTTLFVVESGGTPAPFPTR